MFQDLSVCLVSLHMFRIFCANYTEETITEIKMATHREKLPQNLGGFPSLVLTIISFHISAVNGLALNVLDQLIYLILFPNHSTHEHEKIFLN